MNEAALPPADDQLIANAHRMIRTAALYILFVGGIGLFVEPPSGLFVLLIGAAVLAGAWAIRTIQSRLVASAFLLGAVALFTQRIMSGYRTVTGILLMSAWVVGGVYSVYATVTYHRARKSRGA